jgi:GNAT superfamily N-acetyltransferase
MVRVDEVVTYVEMTSPDQLVPGRPAPEPVEMRLQDVTAAARVKAVHNSVARAYQWASLARTEREWREQLARPHRWHWLAMVGTGPATGAGERPAGLLAVVSHPGGDCEIDMFGLVPDFVGRGFGGHVLTLSVRLAWAAEPLDAPAIRRVWLHTSTLDHPNALANYQARGFRVFRTEKRGHHVPDA